MKRVRYLDILRNNKLWRTSSMGFSSSGGEYFSEGVHTIEEFSEIPDFLEDDCVIVFDIDSTVLFAEECNEPILHEENIPGVIQSLQEDDRINYALSHSSIPDYHRDRTVDLLKEFGIDFDTTNFPQTKLLFPEYDENEGLFESRGFIYENGMIFGLRESKTMDQRSEKVVDLLRFFHHSYIDVPSKLLYVDSVLQNVESVVDNLSTSFEIDIVGIHFHVHYQVNHEGKLTLKNFVQDLKNEEFTSQRAKKICVLNGPACSGKSLPVDELKRKITSQFEFFSLDSYVSPVFDLYKEEMLEPEKLFFDIMESTDTLYEDISESVRSNNQKKVFFLDTILSHLHGEADVERSIYKLGEVCREQDLELKLILMYTPFHILVSRLQMRNEIALREGMFDHYRDINMVLRFDDFYRPFNEKEDEKEDIVGVITRKQIKEAYVIPEYEMEFRTEEDLEDLEYVYELEEAVMLGTFFGGDSSFSESTEIVPNLKYDYILDTTIYSPQEISDMIISFLEK